MRAKGAGGRKSTPLRPGATAGTAAVITAAAPKITAAMMATATATAPAPALTAEALLTFAAVTTATGLAAFTGGLPALRARFAAVALATAMTVMAMPVSAISAGERLASTGGRRGGGRFFGFRFAAEKSLQPADDAAGRFGLFVWPGQRGALLELGLLGPRGARFESGFVAALGAEGATLFTARTQIAARFAAFLAEGTGVPALGHPPAVFRREDVERSFLLGSRRGRGRRGSDDRRRH